MELRHQRDRRKCVHVIEVSLYTRTVVEERKVLHIPLYCISGMFFQGSQTVIKLLHQRVKFSCCSLLVAQETAGQYVSEQLLQLAMQNPRFKKSRSFRRGGRGGGRGGGGGKGGGGGESRRPRPLRPGLGATAEASGPLSPLLLKHTFLST